jgi:CRISPR/Cas system-associated exonuclease Cas4 (RecB family)
VVLNNLVKNVLLFVQKMSAKNPAPLKRGTVIHEIIITPYAEFTLFTPLYSSDGECSHLMESLFGKN